MKKIFYIEGIHYYTGKPVQLKIGEGKILEIKTIEKLEGKDFQYLAPGFFDNQLNGFAGVSFSLGKSDFTREEVEKVTRELWKKGVTTFLPTLTTNSQEVLLNNFKVLASSLDDEKLLGSIPGFHLEGPYINPTDGYRGAHPLQFLRLPVWNEFMELYKASNEKILQVTLAPELKGALDFITKCQHKNIVVALGHHDASAETVTAAIDRGAKIATHLGNGITNMINRFNNPFWSQLADDRMLISIICDGFHLPAEEIRAFYKVKGPEKSIITSDATSFAGLQPGIYQTETGEIIELKKDGMLFQPATNQFYGSASPITKGVGHIMKVTSCTMGEAVQMASTNPAKLYGLDNRGTLEPGKRADLILFSMDNFNINIQKTWVKGKLVYESE
ncbi:MAG: amidohydrolase family protein [Prolixibacteraceae bacterium]|nr:amidohydrolase family protein [Prolixibacteraceae bacterium]